MSEDLSQYQAMLEQMGVDISEDSLANIPAPIVSFAAGSFIGKWSGFMGYWFMSQEDDVLRRANGEEIPAPDLRNQWSEWFHYYYRDYDEANAAYEILVGSNDFSPDQVWVFYAPSADIIVAPDRRENFNEAFGEMIVKDVKIKRLQNGSSQYPAKNRHQYNLISLPAAVAAQADALGMENAGFDVTELMVAEADSKAEADESEGEKIFFDDETFKGLCGDIEGGYMDSILWKRRVALWKSLGEEDGKKSAMTGSKTARGKPHSLATKAPKLSLCLSIAQGRWTSPRWLELASLHDPLPGNVSSSGRRNTIPAIVRVFKNEDEARKAWAEANPEAGNEDGSADGSPPVPANWQGAPVEDWIAALAGQAGKPPMVAKEELYCEAEDVTAWREWLKNNPQ